jgi:hypothetical protein
MHNILLYCNFNVSKSSLTKVMGLFINVCNPFEFWISLYPSDRSFLYVTSSLVETKFCFILSPLIL